MLGSFNLGKRLYVLTFAVVAALEDAEAQNPQKSSAASCLSEKGRSFHWIHLACSLSCSPEAPLAHWMSFWESHFPSWQHAQVFLSEPGGSPVNKARILYCGSQQKACTKDVLTDSTARFSENPCVELHMKRDMAGVEGRVWK